MRIKFKSTDGDVAPYTQMNQCEALFILLVIYDRLASPAVKVV
jgi:hypothetical protein